MYRTLFKRKIVNLCEKLRLFGLFSGDKDNYVDVWSIKTTIMTDQIDIAFYGQIQKPLLSLKSGFFHINFIG